MQKRVVSFRFNSIMSVTTFSEVCSEEVGKGRQFQTPTSKLITKFKNVEKIQNC